MFLNIKFTFFSNVRNENATYCYVLYTYIYIYVCGFNFISLTRANLIRSAKIQICLRLKILRMDAYSAYICTLFSNEELFSSSTHTFL